MTYEPMARASDVNIWAITVKFVSCLSFIQGVVCCRNGLGHAPKTLPGFLTVIYEPIYLSTTLFVLRVHQKHVV